MIRLHYYSDKVENNVFANNIIYNAESKGAWIDEEYLTNGALNLHNNFWVGNKPANWRNCIGPEDL